MAKETYYFSHDANARNDEKILMLRSEHGMLGYGVYWALIESMFETEDTKLRHDKIRGLALGLGVDITALQHIINTCITEKLFVSDGEYFWSESLMKRKNKYHAIKQAKSEAGKKGMARRWGTVENSDTHNSVITDDNSVITKNNKGKEIKGNKRKEKNILHLESAERIWNLYPNKKGKAIALKKITKHLADGYDEKQIIEATLRYAKEVEGKDPAYIKHGSTFYNTGIYDYLGIADETPQAQREEKPLTEEEILRKWGRST